MGRNSDYNYGYRHRLYSQELGLLHYLSFSVDSWSNIYLVCWFCTVTIAATIAIIYSAEFILYCRYRFGYCKIFQEFNL